MTASNSYTWSAPGGTGNWNSAASWGGEGPPGANDIAYFTGLDSTVTGTGTVGAIVAEGAQTVTFDANITVLGLPSETYAFAVTANADITFGPGRSLIAPTIGVGITGGASTLDLNQSSVTTTATTIGAGGGAGLVSLDSGAFWDNTGDMRIGTGAGSVGDLSISANAELLMGEQHGHPKTLVLGATRGAEGALSITGGGQLALYGNLEIGGKFGAPNHGTGQMQVGSSGYASISDTLSINAGSALSLADGNIGAGVLINGPGALISGSGYLGGADLINNAEILAQGPLIVGANEISGAGTIGLSSGATVTLLPATLSGNTIAFLGSAASLEVQQTSTFGGTIAGFAPGDTILAEFATRLTFDASTDVLTVYDGSPEAGTLTLSGNYAADTFHLHQSNGFGVITVTHQ